jgi:hypothetical protein
MIRPAQLLQNRRIAASSARGARVAGVMHPAGSTRALAPTIPHPTHPRTTESR